jgi:uncharacterized protein YndB with AHSA1/START domain
MPTSSCVVSAERIIHASPGRIFDVLADPTQHPVIDGSRSVRAPRAGAPARLALGARFSMDMRIGLPYRMTSEVVQFEEGRRIAWQHLAHDVWCYELEPVDGATRVRESFDWSHGRGQWFLRITKTPEKNRRSMEHTLERLAGLVEGGADRGPA